MEINAITGTIVDTALYIHQKLGPGLLESVYLRIMEHELQKRGLRVRREVEVPVVWDDLKLDVGFRADLIVEDVVIVELKSIEALARVHKKQVLTYLRLTDLQIGLLINFGEELLKDGLERIVNGYKEAAMESS